jgi:hypothetical protein
MFALQAKQDGVFDRTDYKKGQYCSKNQVRGAQATDDINEASLMGTHFGDVQVVFTRTWRDLNRFFDFVEMKDWLWK